MNTETKNSQEVFPANSEPISDILKKMIEQILLIDSPIFISQTGEIKTVIPANGKKFTLVETQAMVNGYIEHVYINHNDNGTVKRFIMIVNEEGKLMKSCAINKTATKYYQRYKSAYDVMVGNVLLTPAKFIG